MNHKSLGNTGTELPEIGFGTSGYGGGVGPLRKAIALGAGFVDTAESYGTEEIVGEAIRGQRNRVFLATKVLPRHFRRRDVFAAADRSLRRLKVDHIDLYQLHWPNYTVPIEETMGALEELVDLGKIRFIGVSNFSATQLRTANRGLSKHRIVSNQVRYSLIDRTIEGGLLPYCCANQITIIAYSPLGRGLLHIRNRDPEGVLSRVATLTGKTEAQVALNWCLAKQGVIAIPKANSIDHVVENCNASGWRLSPDQIKLLEEGIRFHRRGHLEALLRRLARGILQRFGHNLGSYAPQSFPVMVDRTKLPNDVRVVPNTPGAVHKVDGKNVHWQ